MIVKLGFLNTGVADRAGSLSGRDRHQCCAWCSGTSPCIGAWEEGGEAGEPCWEGEQRGPSTPTYPGCDPTQQEVPHLLACLAGILHHHHHPAQHPAAARPGDRHPGPSGQRNPRHAWNPGLQVQPLRPLQRFHLPTSGRLVQDINPSHSFTTLSFALVACQLYCPIFI